MTNLDQTIVHVLAEAGQAGLSVQKVALHVHHHCNTLFNTVELKDVHAYVKQFLARQSRNPGSVIERTDRRGVYRINTQTADTRQQMLDFGVDSPDERDKEQEAACEDLSLSLF